MTHASTRIPLILGNWKMNTTLEDAYALADAAAESASAHPEVEVGVLPPAVWLVPLAAHLGRGSALMLGAQDNAPEPAGAFTGDLSAEMVAPYTRFLLAGHSERRHLHGEGDELVRAKLDAIYRVDRVPVLAVGETGNERAAGRARDVVSRQLGAALHGRPVDQLQALVIAYEPVWAIGTGTAATPEDAAEMAALIRDWLRGVDPLIAERVRILYGGSVTADNAGEILASVDVDGGLVGGASLKPAEFAAIVAAAAGQQAPWPAVPTDH
jgi:triosephosphate isomerase